MEAADLRTLYDQTSNLIEKTLVEAEAMEALLAMGEGGRVDRSEHKPIEVLVFTFAGAQTITGRVQGVEKVYDVRITLAPKRGYRCTCPDSRRRGASVGPCKHTLALARHRLDELQPEVARLYNGLVGCLF